MSTPEEQAAPRRRRSVIGWILLGGLVAYAAFVHHGFGAVPETFDLAWYNPRSTMIYWFQASSAAPLVNNPPLGIAVLTLPALVLGVAAFALLRSAVGRMLAVAGVIATAAFLRFGLEAPGAWRLYQELFSELMLAMAIVIAAGLVSPLLAASWLRLGWVLRIAIYAPLFLLAVVLMRNATGFDPSAPFNLSLWPTVPAFGLQVVNAGLALLHAGVALALAGVALRAARPPLEAIAALAGVVALGVTAATLGVTGWVPALVVTAAAALAIFLARRAPASRLRRAALPSGVAAALIAVPLLVGQGWVELDYLETRDERAQELIDGLAAYYEDETTYPDSLQELVERGYLESIPEPAIGFAFLSDQRFSYQAFGDNYLLEFAAPGWVQCQYNPPWIDEFGEEIGEDLAEEDVGGVWQCPPPRPPDIF